MCNFELFIEFVCLFVVLLINIKIGHSNVLLNLSKLYGPIFTFFIGSTPVVFICDQRIGKILFTKTETADRMDERLCSYYEKNLRLEKLFAFRNYNENVINSRKITISSFR